MSFAGLWTIHRINEIHEKAFGLVCKNEVILSSDDLDISLISDIHQKNLHILTTKIYKVRSDLGLVIMKNIFHFVKKPYNLRNDSTLQKQKKLHSVLWNRQHIFSYSKTWELASCKIKNAKSLDIFKE